MTVSTNDTRRMRRYAMSAGAAVAGAIGVSLCCIGPFVLFAAGVGSVHLVDALAPYRAWIIGGELVAYLAYRRFRPAPACAAEEVGPVWKQVVFWGALIAVISGIMGVAVW
jgi:hypothetical protein